MFAQGGRVVWPGEGGVSTTHTHTPGQTPLPPRDSHWSGQYASYWNTFLFFREVAIFQLWRNNQHCGNLYVYISSLWKAGRFVFCGLACGQFQIFFRFLKSHLISKIPQLIKTDLKRLSCFLAKLCCTSFAHVSGKSLLSLVSFIM